MKPVSIKLQKVFAYIPYINVLNIFLWLYNCMCRKVPVREFHAVWGRILPQIVIPGVLPFVCSFVSPELADKLGLVNVYLLPLLAGRVLIAYQEQELGLV